MILVELEVSGQTITEQQVNWTVWLQTSGGFEFRIEGAFALSDVAGRSARANPDDDLETRTAAMGTLLGGTLSAASIAENGTLRISMQDGRVLSADADEQFEAWTVAGPAGLKIACLPGGELAVWSPHSSAADPA